ncbi:MAG: glycosyltransferase family 2 protein [Myxococcus sp.]|nr:glycosyltransferase family 2 protein [Myxococcus sp.]
MSVGGFILSRNSPRIDRAVRSLAACCDQVLVVDTGSTDDTVERAAASGAEVKTVPWLGFGNARRQAVSALGERGHDYALFIDSDEFITDDDSAKLRAFFRSGLWSAGHRLRLNEWVTTPRRRFLFRTGYRTRLFRVDAARYEDWMLIHERPRVEGARPVSIAIEHDYLTENASRSVKARRYALLWAIVHRQRSAKPEAVQLVSHLVRNLLVKGALWRGGPDAVVPALVEARYHAEKQRALRQVQAGLHDEKVRAFEAGNWAEVIAAVEQSLEPGAPAAALTR